MNSFQRFVFKARRKIFYFFHGRGRYRTHSQYVYDLYTQCLRPYRKLDLDSRINQIDTYIKTQNIKTEYCIITNINSSPKTLNNWREKIRNHSGLSVETYDFGIIFYSEGFAKQEHVLR